MEIAPKSSGDELTADEFNQLPSELQNLIQNYGILLDNSDLVQVQKALANVAASGSVYSDSGSDIAYVLDRLDTNNGDAVTQQEATVMIPGMTVYFKANTTNTSTVPTLEISGLNSYTITTDTSGALAVGIIVAGGFYGVQFNGTNWLLKESLSFVRKNINNTFTSGTTQTFDTINAESVLVTTNGSNEDYSFLSAFASTSSDNDNVSFGSSAGARNCSGEENTTVGVNAGRGLQNGDHNTCIGFSAGFDLETGNSNTLIGCDAGKYVEDGNFNTIMGYQAKGINNRGRLSGNNNTLIGTFACTYLTTGSQNTCIGMSAGNFLTTGSDCTSLGFNAGNSFNTGDKNTSIGSSAGRFSGTGTNNTCIGFNATASVDGVSNQVTIGDNNVSSLRCNVQTISSLSDARDKKDTLDLSLGLDYINLLRPVEFTWDRRDNAEQNGNRDIGFIAQELSEVQDEFNAEHVASVCKSNPKKLEASYGRLLPIAIQAIKELSAKVELLEAAINEQS